MAALQGTHDVDADVSRRLLSALEAFGDVLSLDGELHVRPGVDLHEPPPEPPPPPTLPPLLASSAYSPMSHLPAVAMQLPLTSLTCRPVQWRR